MATAMATRGGSRRGWGSGRAARRSPAGVWRRGSRAIEPPNPKINRQTTAKTKHQNPKAPATRPPSLEQRVAAMQRDSATYCDEPEDLAGFERWTSGFDVDSPTVSAEVECVLEGNAFMAELQARIVPLVVTREEFWQRYFYALRRIKLEFGVEKEEEDKEAAAESGGDEGKAEEEPEPEVEVEDTEVEPEVEVEAEAEVEAEPEPVAEATPASEPPAHPRVATISAADSAEESGVTSDGSWAKVTSDGEVVEKTETKKKPAVERGRGNRRRGFPARRRFEGTRGRRRHRRGLGDGLRLTPVALDIESNTRTTRTSQEETKLAESHHAAASLVFERSPTKCR